MGDKIERLQSLLQRSRPEVVELAISQPAILLLSSEKLEAKWRLVGDAVQDHAGLQGDLRAASGKSLARMLMRSKDALEQRISAVRHLEPEEMAARLGTGNKLMTLVNLSKRQYEETFPEVSQ